MGVTDSRAKVSVVTVLYESADVIEGCLASIPPAVEVVVVDNASSDDGAARALGARPDAILIRSELNLGFGGGCNLGWKRAGAEYIAFVNPDVRLHAGLLETLVERLGTEPHGMVGPAMLDGGGMPRRCNKRWSPLIDSALFLPSAARWAPKLGLDEKLDAADPIHRDGGVVSHVEGACFVIRRGDLEAIGGFDRDLFLYGEEVSLALRLAALGGRAVYVPQARAEHSGAHSTESIGALATMHFYRSRVLVYRKRDGDLRGLLAAALIALGALLSMPTAFANSLLRRMRARRPQTVWSVLSGVLRGALARSDPGLDYPRGRASG